MPPELARDSRIQAARLAPAQARWTGIAFLRCPLVPRVNAVGTGDVPGRSRIGRPRGAGHAVPRVGDSLHPDKEADMTIGDILRAKGGDVVTVAPDALVTDAMRLLVRHNIGALVVVWDGALAGIVSERDVLRAGAVDLSRLAHATVAELMTRDVIAGTPDMELREVMDTMTEHRIRHLPILRGRELAGMVSIGDVVNALRRSTEDEVHYLHAYIAGTPL